ncbi:MAG TPA: hypothetical protein VGI96_33785, partial [Streptosporangiaceae bacterium]
MPAAAHGSAGARARCAGHPESPAAATPAPAPDTAPAGSIGPALAAGLDPAGYPAVPGGVPQAWERAQVYLGLCERYRDLYQAQLAELHLLMATAPGSS